MTLHKHVRVIAAIGIAAALLLALAYYAATAESRTLARARAATVTVHVLVPEASRDPEGSGRPTLYRTTNGSGFFLDHQGRVVTNAHVVDRAVRIEIEMADGSRHRAQLLGSDRLSDVAVLTTDVRNPSTLPLATGEPRIGDTVLAIGSPYGLTGSVSRGIVAGIGRSLRDSSPNWLVQHTAVIDPGSSGGPVLNAAGEVIGINSSLPDGRFEFAGIALAVEAKVVDQVTRQLIARKMDRADLGLTLRAITQPLSIATGLTRGAGVIVTGFAAGSPAARSLRIGDVITAINGTKTASLSDAVRLVALNASERPMRIQFSRNGTENEAVVTPGRAAPDAGPAPIDRDPIGITFRATSQDPVISAIQQRSMADAAGLRAGDRILAVGLKPVASRTEAQRALEDVRPLIALTVRRREGSPTIVVLGSYASAVADLDANQRGSDNADV